MAHLREMKHSASVHNYIWDASFGSTANRETSFGMSACQTTISFTGWSLHYDAVCLWEYYIAFCLTLLCSAPCIILGLYLDWIRKRKLQFYLSDAFMALKLEKRFPLWIGFPHTHTRTHARMHTHTHAHTHTHKKKTQQASSRSICVFIFHVLNNLQMIRQQ